MTDCIQTERLVLRRIKPQDRADLVDLLSRWDVVRNLSRWPHPLDEAMVDDLIARHQGPKLGGFAIALDDRVIGLISESSSMGFMLHPDFWGQGFMTEALGVMQDMLLPRFEALSGGAFSANAASIRVFQKCGWHEVATETQYCRALDKELPLRCFVKCARYDWLKPIRTQRLLLRPLHLDDFDAIWTIVSDEDIVRLLLTWPIPADEAFTRDRLAAAQAKAGLVSAIERDGSVIGMIGYGKGTLYYFLQRDMWGRGFATEALRGKLSTAFADSSVEKVTAGTWDDNPASMRVLEKLGFVQTGRNTVFHPGRQQDISGPDFALTRANWQALQ